MSLRPWTFLVREPLHLQRIPEAYYASFRARTQALPGAGLPVAHVAELVLLLARRRPVHLTYSAFVRYRLTKDGRRRATDCTSEVAAAVGIAGGFVNVDPALPNVRSIVPRLSRKRLCTEHAWDPPFSVLEVLSEYINVRADAVIVVPGYGRLLSTVGEA